MATSHNPHLDDVLSDDEDGDVCRICRMGSQADDPLFYPCKCSGSIKYVHQQCLLDWLQHSGNTHCEVGLPQVPEELYLGRDRTIV